MPPRPFPYPFRVGTDICNISRLKRVFTGRNDGTPLRPLSRLMRRILTEPERTYFWHRFGPPANIQTKFDAIAQYLAGRFAAKEACRKACDHFSKDSRAFHQIIILPISPLNEDEHQSSAPQGLILDQVYEIRAFAKGTDRESPEVAPRNLVDPDELEGQLCEISISHDGDFATAVAIVPSMDPDKRMNKFDHNSSSTSHTTPASL